MDIVKLFNEISKEDVESAGGKGASLGEMIQAKIPVPNGFVILSQTFDNFIQESSIKSEIDSILKKVNIENTNSVNDASEKIKYLILNAEIPKEISQEILESFKLIDTKFVAVRSSATSEDSEDAAWAGQLDTFLNTTEKNLLENVKKCWASLFTPRAIFYRFEKKLDETKISVAAVVQKMIQSEISGIAFSVHPVTQNKNQILIEAGLGLGEAVVSGSITPDSYVIKKDSLEVEEININKQTKKLERKGDENAWVEIKKEGKKRFLDNKKIKKLTKLIIQIENHYGFPCDIEWAYEKDKFYITQSRPITTLNEEPEKEIMDEYKRFGTRDYSLMQLDMENEIGKMEHSPLYRFLEEIVFVHEKNKGTGFYFNCSDDSDENSSHLIKYFNKNPKQFEKIIREYKQNRKRIIQLCSEEKDLEKIYKLAIKVSAALSVLSIISEPDPNNSKKLMKKAKNIRDVTDKTIYDVRKTFKKLLKKQLPTPLKKYYKFVRFREMRDMNFPSIKELKKREGGFVFYKDKVYTSISKDKFGKINNIWFNDEKVVKNKGTIQGQVGFEGKVRGSVKIIYQEEQMKQMKQGEILVSPMTTPNLLPAIKKAKAIITDEGGITCHAAIVSRELKKPCIVGTKIATQILNDGDLIEVDAKKGIVRILKKSKK